MRLLTILFLSAVLGFSAFAQQQQQQPSGRKSKLLAEPFTGTSLGGKDFNLTELRGKVVLVAFWSTRCPICAAEIPKLNNLAAIFRDKDVVFLGLTVENDDKVKQYVKKKPFDFILLPNSFGILLKYADKDADGNVTMGYPAYFLVNQNGEIELKTGGFDKTETLAAQISRLLKSEF